MFLIVGLGNPGIEYNKTFHNIGFMTVDFMLEDLEILAKKNEIGRASCRERVYVGV